MQQPGGRQPQHLAAVAVEQTVIHPAGLAFPAQLGVFLPPQQPLFGQIVQVDEIGVAGKGGEGLVGRIPVAGGTDGQNLPAGLAALLQKIKKIPGRAAQSAHPPGGRQRCNRQQNAGASFHGRIPLS